MRSNDRERALTSSLHTPQLRVCLVEDDEAVRESFRYVLERQGIFVWTFDSPRTFLITNRVNECDCLILDMRMPFMNGLELLELLRARAIAKPAIMVTGATHTAFEGRARRAGVVQWLHKPVSPKDLVDAVRAATAQ